MDAVRNATAGHSENVAFMWAPNTGQGYPYQGYGLITTTTADIAILDINGDGKVNEGDDPYSPYYPGDDYVDWVRSF